MTGTRPPGSREGPLSPGAAGSPPAPQGGGSGRTGRGLNSTSAARRPLKSATRKMRCRRASRGSAQYWASRSRQQRSGHPPRTIPAFAHLPAGGIEISASVKADSTALKSIRSFEENAPMTLCIKKCYAESIANLSVYLAKNINNRLVILRITRYHRHTGKYRNNSDGGDGNVSRCSADNSRPNAGYRR